MKIAIVSSDPGIYGAGRAMRRLADALAQRGHQVDIFHLTSTMERPDQILVRPRDDCANDKKEQANVRRLFGLQYFCQRRSRISNTVFASQLSGYSFADAEFIKDYDIVNIHWSEELLGVSSVAQIAEHGIPVIFTMHDMATFTGGCHYSAGCTEYKRACANCHLLVQDELNLTAFTLQLKRKYYHRKNLFAVAPSRWLARAANDSGIFDLNPAGGLSNGLDTSVFRPYDRTASKIALGIRPDVSTVILGAVDNKETRKGFHQLIDATRHLHEDPRGRTLEERNLLKIIVFGKGAEALSEAGLPVQAVGFVDNDEQLAKIYSAADLLVLPSLEDNQPNVLVEAAACGVPTVAFNVGGIGEMIEHQRTGWLIPPFDTKAMAMAILALLTDDKRAVEMGAAASEAARRSFSLDALGARYESYFRSALAKIGNSTSTKGTQRYQFPVGDKGERYVELPRTFAPEIREGVYGQLLQREISGASLDSGLERTLDQTIDMLQRSRSWRLGSLLSFRPTPAPPGEDATASEKLQFILTALQSGRWDLTASSRLVSRLLSRVSAVCGRHAPKKAAPATVTKKGKR